MTADSNANVCRTCGGPLPRWTYDGECDDCQKQAAPNYPESDDCLHDLNNPESPFYFGSDFESED